MQRKIKQCKNPVFKDFLEIKLAELVDIEKYRSDREYYLMCFAETAEQLNDIRDKISASLITYNLAEIMSKEKKKQILYKYNNPNTALFSVGKENK